MAQAITNTGFVVQSSLGAYHQSIADQAIGTTTTTDTAITGLKWIRVRGYVKTFGTLTTSDVYTVTVTTGTGASITDPVNTAQYAFTVLSGQTTATFDLYGWSNAGFRSYSITIGTSSSHTCTTDLLVDCA